MEGVRVSNPQEGKQQRQAWLVPTNLATEGCREAADLVPWWAAAIHTQPLGRDGGGVTLSH